MVGLSYRCMSIVSSQLVIGSTAVCSVIALPYLSDCLVCFVAFQAPYAGCIVRQAHGWLCCVWSDH